MQWISNDDKHCLLKVSSGDISPLTATSDMQTADIKVSLVNVSAGCSLSGEVHSPT